eukprot:Lithocolla_globosa_v1_NODE_7757_length_904_cov_3.702002.p2 type:complete len:107 gc:universal NODE_7757_length_904_cov_3.702002:565-245(-)
MDQVANIARVMLDDEFILRRWLFFKAFVLIFALLSIFLHDFLQECRIRTLGEKTLFIQHLENTERLFGNQIDRVLVVFELYVGPVHPFASVFFLFLFENVLIEEEL